MIERIAELRDEAEAAIGAAATSAELEELRVRYLGRKAELPNVLRGIAQLPAEQRGPTGKAANQARQALEALIGERGEQLAGGELEARLRADVVDVTLPGAPPQPVGRLHLLTATRREIEDVFLGLGFRIAEGPEVETVYYNFDALNHAPTHPARDRLDTFYVDGRRTTWCCARTPRRCRSARWRPSRRRCTSSSPAACTGATPTRRTRRSSTRSRASRSTRTSRSPTSRARCWRSPARSSAPTARSACARTSSRSPSRRSRSTSRASWTHRDGQRCRVCKDTGWIEILGSGMVDPNVFGYVAEHGYDPERVQGFAFGMGIERIAMLKHGVPDLRLLYDNDVRFLEQFG